MIRIGTRGSQLALWQARDLQSQLAAKSINSELVIIKTKGDQIQNLTFDKIEGKGFFTKEIEDALLANEVDVAVHSLKDLPTQMISGLVLAGLSQRASPADILISSKSVHDPSRILRLKSGTRIGTSSIRRQVQIQHFDTEVEILPVRGNVPTRIGKIDNGEVDAVVLAAAGVERLDIDLSNYNQLKFNPIEFVPAPAQGVIGYQCRTEDTVTRSIIAGIHNADTARCTNVERDILRLLDGGCQLPLGAYVHSDYAGNFHCYTMLGTTLGSPINHFQCSWSTASGLSEHIVKHLKPN
ncbi:MAG: hydroxymethylbilane synthase [Bacteroidota bacterium]